MSPAFVNLPGIKGDPQFVAKSKVVTVSVWNPAPTYGLPATMVTLDGDPDRIFTTLTPAEVVELVGQ